MLIEVGSCDSNENQSLEKHIFISRTLVRFLLMNYAKIRTYNEIVDFVHSRNNNEKSPLIELRSKNKLHNA